MTWLSERLPECKYGFQRQALFADVMNKCYEFEATGPDGGRLTFASPGPEYSDVNPQVQTLSYYPNVLLQAEQDLKIGIRAFHLSAFFNGTRWRPSWTFDDELRLAQDAAKTKHTELVAARQRVSDLQEWKFQNR